MEVGNDTQTASDRVFNMLAHQDLDHPVCWDYYSRYGLDNWEELKADSYNWDGRMDQFTSPTTLVSSRTPPVGTGSQTRKTTRAFSDLSCVHNFYIGSGSINLSVMLN